MDGLLKADYMELIQVGAYVAVGWYVATEVTKIVWAWVHGLLTTMMVKMKPKD